MTTVVRRNDNLDRYEITVDGDEAGFVTFRMAGDVITFVHTETKSEFEGQGIASRLISEALADVRGRSQRVVPQCPFVRAFIDKHPEYQDLLVEQ